MIFVIVLVCAFLFEHVPERTETRCGLTQNIKRLCSQGQPRPSQPGRLGESCVVAHTDKRICLAQPECADSRLAGEASSCKKVQSTAQSVAQSGVIRAEDAFTKNVLRDLCWLRELSELSIHEVLDDSDIAAPMAEG
eukprot:1717880-Amphidinium_carterae.1